jgi:hypothetical protein
VEFKVTGLPTGWMVNTATPPAPALVLGDPFGSVGAIIGFYDPQTGNCVRLFTVTITATTQVDEVILEVTAKTPPTDPYQDCPIVVIHCSSCSTHVCVSGGRLYINSAHDCVVSVAPTTWSAVKRLYD